MSLQLYTDSMRDAWLAARPGQSGLFDRWLLSVREDGAVGALRTQGRTELASSLAAALGSEEDAVDPSEIELIVARGPGAARDEKSSERVLGAVEDLAITWDGDADEALREGESGESGRVMEAKVQLQRALVLGHAAHSWVSEHGPINEPEDLARRALYLGDLDAIEQLCVDGEQEALGHLAEDVDEMMGRYERAGLTPATPNVEQVGIHARAAERRVGRPMERDGEAS